MPMAIACYIRVSSDSQSHQSQRAEIERWLDRSSIDPSKVVWFADVESGTKIRRPEFDRMQKAINDGQVTAVVCYKLDRVARNFHDGINVVADWCEKGIRFTSITEGIDVTGTMGMTMAAMLFGFAQIATEYRKERQAGGIAKAKERGAYTGRKPGATKRYRGQRPGSKKKAPDRAIELRARGLTAPAIAQEMGVSLRSVWRYLGRAATS
jgi:DNA invertase Pin-like site-specific DNA recombinase